MAFQIIDAFNRPDSPNLGTTSRGYPWRTERGSVSIKSGRAFAPSNADNLGSFASIDAGLLGGDAIISATLAYQSDYEGGHALYFRVVDGNNWWRLGVQRERVMTGSRFVFTGDPNYPYTCNITYYYDDGRVESGGSYNADRDKSGTYYGPGYHESHSCYRQGYYEYSYAYYWELRLDRCVNGSISSIAARRTDNNARPDLLSVSARGSSISCSMNGGSPFFVVSDGTHSQATRHGVGYQPLTTYSNALGIEDFSIEPFNKGLYVPAVML